MPKYVFKARNLNNEAVDGFRNAGTERELVSTLRNEGLVVFSVKEVKDEASRKEKKRAAGMKGGAVGQADVAIFCRQLATLINAGVSILDGIDDLSEMVPNARFSKLLKTVANDVREGSTMSDALKKHQKVFGKIFIAMISAGEKSGKLGKVLSDLAIYLESSIKLRRKVKAASAYPIFVGGFFILALGALVLFVIPRFKAIFISFGAELPLPTRIIMGISETAIKNIHWIILLLIGTITGTTMSYRTTPGRMFFDNLKLRMPIFGEIMTKVVFARFFQTLSTLLQSGIDIVASLEIAGKVTNNLPVERMIGTIRSRVIEGSTISGEMEKFSLFPRMVVRMTAIGEKSGKLDEMFVKLSEYYNDEIDAAVSIMSSIIEPLLIILLGLVVGIAVVAMYLPMFKMALAVMGKGA